MTDDDDDRSVDLGSEAIMGGRDRLAGQSPDTNEEIAGEFERVPPRRRPGRGAEGSC